MLKKSLFSKSNSMGWKCRSVSETTGAVEHFWCSSTGKLSAKIWWKTRDACMTPSPNTVMQVKPTEPLPFDSDIMYQFLEWGLTWEQRKTDSGAWDLVCAMTVLWKIHEFHCFCCQIAKVLELWEHLLLNTEFKWTADLFHWYFYSPIWFI